MSSSETATREVRVLLETAQPYFSTDQLGMDDDELDWLTFEIGDDSSSNDLNIYLVDEGGDASSVADANIFIKNAWTGYTSQFFAERTDDNGKVTMKVEDGDVSSTQSNYRRAHLLPFSGTEFVAYGDDDEAAGYVSTTVHSFYVGNSDGGNQQNINDYNEPVANMVHREVTAEIIFDATSGERK